MQNYFQKNDPAQALQYFKNKMSFTTGPVELDRALKQHENLVVIDVRAAEDFQKGHIPGSINLPKDRWNKPEGLRQDALNVVLCYSQVCHLAANAAAEFAGRGFPVMELEGGFKAWEEHELEIEKSAQTKKRDLAMAG